MPGCSVEEMTIQTGGISAEISARLTEHAFYELDAPVGRVCSVEVPMPYPRHLEQAAMPNIARIVAGVRLALDGGASDGAV